jgi:hypothetical protein
MEKTIIKTTKKKIIKIIKKNKMTMKVLSIIITLKAKQQINKMKENLSILKVLNKSKNPLLKTVILLILNKIKIKIKIKIIIIIIIIILSYNSMLKMSFLEVKVSII